MTRYIEHNPNNSVDFDYESPQTWKGSIEETNLVGLFSAIRNRYQ